ELPGLFYLRSLEDSRRIRESASKAQRAIVIGGGYIGLETSAVLAQKGLPTTVVLSGETLLPRLFTPEMADFFRRYYEARGVTFVSNAKVTTINGDERATGVTLDSGRELEGDLVLA